MLPGPRARLRDGRGVSWARLLRRGGCAKGLASPKRVGVTSALSEEVDVMRLRAVVALVLCGLGVPPARLPSPRRIPTPLARPWAGSPARSWSVRFPCGKASATRPRRSRRRRPRPRPCTTRSRLPPRLRLDRSGAVLPPGVASGSRPRDGPRRPEPRLHRPGRPQGGPERARTRPGARPHRQRIRAASHRAAGETPGGAGRPGEPRQTPRVQEGDRRDPRRPDCRSRVVAAAREREEASAAGRGQRGGAASTAFYIRPCKWLRTTARPITT